MKKLKTLTWALALTLTLPAYSAQTIDTRLVNGSNGKPVFEVRFFGMEDGQFLSFFEEGVGSTWNLSDKQKNKIINAVQLWADIIEPAPNQSPTIINVGTFDEENAFGGGSIYLDNNNKLLLSMPQANVQGKDDTAPFPDDFGAHGYFTMGLLDFENEDDVPAALPRTNHVDLKGVAFHELAHSLGVISMISDKNGQGTPHFQSIQSTYGQYMYDDNGNPSQADQAIICSGCNNEYDPKAFDLRKDQGFFSAPHVDEVLAGGLVGIPLRILGRDGDVDTDYMSHLELNNSMMSHQSYRNYNTFMEAELALMQDLGYQLDRRNFFGHSVYGSGLHVLNTNGFFKRNADGTAYLAGEYNTSTLGVGLHVYGSQNTISQQADLLTVGDGGTGIRVDGEGNTLTIDPNTRVYADGLNGRGVLFAYGKDHHLIQQGDVQALGEKGIAVAFDFGNNSLGNELNYQGSYIYTHGHKDLPLIDELNGALVNQFDLSGRVAGTDAAIYLSPNALVKQINVLPGARIDGDIISDYAQRDENDQLRLTTLHFGQPADAAFDLRYDDNIDGSNIAVVAQGGQTALNGTHQLFSMRVAPSATLTGAASYTLNESERFLNDGTIAPGNNDFGRMTIHGDYQQSADGMIVADVNGAGQHATLAVTGHATLDGYLSLYAKPDWYAQDWTLRSDAVFQSASRSGDFAAIGAVMASPTLWLDTAPIGAGVSQLFITRYEDAYSQYAQNRNEYAVGQALYEVAHVAQPDMHPLYTALDFSAIDGSTIHSALSQLSPAAYSAMAASSLRRERLLTAVIRDRAAPSVGTDWQAFATPFGERTSQDQHGSLVASKNNSYGLVMGTEKKGLGQQADLALGVYGAISRQRVSLRDNLSGKGHSTALHLGTQLRFAPNPKAGLYAFGSAQLGWEDSKFDR